MDKNSYLRDNFGLSERAIAICNEAENAVREQFSAISDMAELNTLRVMKAFSDKRVSEAHFVATSGYGYDDLGRDTLDEVFAQVFDAEDALVRHNFISGTHTLATMLYAVLRPGDVLLAVTGKPYDTLEETIGISGEAGRGSLADYGVGYEEVELLDNGEPDYESIKQKLTEKKIRAVLVQRSKGYAVRPTYSAKKIGEIATFVKEISPETVVLVDNCYGEFVDEAEPTAYGADLIAGSLIKNPGGGLAPTGGYIAGKKELVELCAYRLTAVGIGKECGASLGFNKILYQGLFMAPHTVAQALKTAVLAAAVYEKLGFSVEPSPFEKRHDIIQAISFPTKEGLIAFCQGIQSGAPVDSFVVPEPWDMPGYQTQVIMAAGAFVQGASIELSADAPIKEPYTAYMQGGLTYESAKIGIAVSVQRMIEKNLI